MATAIQPDNAVLRERIDVDPSLAIFRVAPSDGEAPLFEPGQFTNLGIACTAPSGEPRLVRRALSIASSPRERAHLEFYVRLVDDGELTPRLFELRPGARLWLDPRVHGHFTLADVPPASNVLFVGTGTGVAPFVSMLRTYAGGERWRRCVLLESARTGAELGYRAELERLQRERSDFRYLPTLTREPAASAWGGLRGRLQAWLEPAAFRELVEEPLDPERWQVLLCGNPEMIASVTELLSGHGFRRHRSREPGQIRSERYW
jgi:ferredoxin--NADP+ reductase